MLHQQLISDSGITLSGPKSLLLCWFAVVPLKSVSTCLGFLICRVGSYKIEIRMGCWEGSQTQYTQRAELCAWHRVHARAGDCLVVVRLSLLGLLPAPTTMPAPRQHCLESCALTWRAMPAPKPRTLFPASRLTDNRPCLVLLGPHGLAQLYTSDTRMVA